MLSKLQATSASNPPSPFLRNAFELTWLAALSGLPLTDTILAAPQRTEIETFIWAVPLAYLGMPHIRPVRATLTSWTRGRWYRTLDQYLGRTEGEESGDGRQRVAAVVDLYLEKARTEWVASYDDELLFGLEAGKPRFAFLRSYVMERHPEIDVPVQFRAVG
jgi:hypothetical protein